MTDPNTAKIPFTLRNGAIIEFFDRQKHEIEIWTGGYDRIGLYLEPQTDDDPGGFSVTRGGIVDHNMSARQMESVALGMLFMLGKYDINSLPANGALVNFK